MFLCKRYSPPTDHTSLHISVQRITLVLFSKVTSNSRHLWSNSSDGLIICHRSTKIHTFKKKSYSRSVTQWVIRADLKCLITHQVAMLKSCYRKLQYPSGQTRQKTDAGWQPEALATRNISDNETCLLFWRENYMQKLPSRNQMVVLVILNKAIQYLD